MFQTIKNWLFPSISSFVIEEIDLIRNIVVCEDKKLGLRVEVLTANKPVKEVRIAGPYSILITYQDGTTQTKKILD
jgi:hypothetical protein